jgi:hypothetical protein
LDVGEEHFPAISLSGFIAVTDRSAEAVERFALGRAGEVGVQVLFDAPVRDGIIISDVEPFPGSPGMDVVRVRGRWCS